MKIFDCFMYFDEELILDIRLNILDKYVDYFVIVESIYTHSGDNRELKFDLNKFKKFKDKIIYLIHDKMHKSVKRIYSSDTKRVKELKYIYNAVYRENDQRNFIAKGLENANNEDIILISDIDEIPKLESIDLKKVKNEIVVFKQDMFHYKFNLCIPNFKWSGTKAIKKKKLISPQWLRNVKDKKYSIYRIDTLFSKKKYTNLNIVNDGGWHFSNLKSPDKIIHKYKSYLHHHEFDESNVTLDDVKNLVNNKQAIYNLNIDQRNSKIGNGVILDKFDINKLPTYISKNLNKYEKWLDQNESILDSSLQKN